MRKASFFSQSTSSKLVLVDHPVLIRSRCFNLCSQKRYPHPFVENSTRVTFVITAIADETDDLGVGLQASV